ncbi:MAG: sigma-54 dependent transcriptional regulator [Candidatus Korobacteraceae bacterium]|jgi:DNA-binding NtrC family response regulator
MSELEQVKKTESRESKVTVLAIDDEADFLEFVGEAISSENVDFLSTTHPEEALTIVQKRHPPVILLDLTMPKASGMEVLERILGIDPNADVVMLTADYSTESAVRAIQQGACDYLLKPITVEHLRERIRLLLQEVRRREHRTRLEEDVYHALQFEGMVGQSPIMQEIFVAIRRIAPHFRTVLIGGATGTGKELVARVLHRLSPVATRPFVVCNCAAITETLLESELFGSVRGAYTGANQDRIGLIEAAHGGVLFLDEIGEMSQAMQAKLLRVFQNQEVRQVGAPTSRKVDVRVVASTHRDLRKMVSQGQFREDLYYRLSMIEIKLPPLADRKEDLRLLEQDILRRYATELKKPVATLTRRAQTVLSRHSWPGNIRELENVLGRGCMMTATSTIDVRDLPDSVKSVVADVSNGGDVLVPLADMQRRHIERVLQSVDGNKARAAEILQISRSSLYRILQQSSDPSGNALVGS